MQNGDATQKNACGVIDTACKIWHLMQNRRTIRAALAAFKGNIYHKHILYMLYNCPTPPLQKYRNLKGLPKNFFVHAVSLTPLARFLRSKINHISANSKQNSKRL
jgi:hypothetical protein